MLPSKTLYIPGNNNDLWSGRNDAKEFEYFFQIIKFLDLNAINTPKITACGYALLCFMCDEGVRRNFGRVGAKEGPLAFREVLSKLPLHSDISLYDAGNVICEHGDLEAAQIELGARVYQILKLGLKPLVIGGGHETAFGHYQGISKYYDDVAILNFDAHFDVRELIDNNKGSSGTPFRQINSMLKAQNKKFAYYCAGIQNIANTKTLFQYAHENSVTYLLAEDIKKNPYDMSWIKCILDKHQYLYVTICLDVFNAASAPGVSAPQALGIDSTFVIESLKILKESGKVVSLDIVELAPKYDICNCTAKLAASLFFNYCMAR